MRRTALSAALTGGALTLILAAPALAGRTERPVERSFAAPPRALELENLAGAVEIVPAGGAALRVTARIQAEAPSDARARELAAALEVEFEERGDRLIVRAVYPLDRHRRFCYPASGLGEAEVPWPLSWFISGGSNVEYQGRRVSVTGRPSDDAPTLYADFRLEVPAGMAVQVRNAVGRIASTGVAGDQVLDAASGDIRVERGSGSLSVDTGSGEVRVADHRGDVAVDTGSGDVHLERVEGARISADTGSGNVDLVAVAGSIDADTGSGDVVGRDLRLGAELSADTGSGDVRLAGDFGAVRDLRIDTGSGDVALTVSRAPAVRLVVSTGSGDIDVDLPDTRVRQSRGEVVAEIGDAQGRGVIGTGSGNVRVRPGA